MLLEIFGGFYNKRKLDGFDKNNTKIWWSCIVKQFETPRKKLKTGRKPVRGVYYRKENELL